MLVRIYVSKQEAQVPGLTGPMSSDAGWGFNSGSFYEVVIVFISALVMGTPRFGVVCLP